MGRGSTGRNNIFQHRLHSEMILYAYLAGFNMDLGNLVAAIIVNRSPQPYNIVLKSQ